MEEKDWSNKYWSWARSTKFETPEILEFWKRPKATITNNLHFLSMNIQDLCFPQFVVDPDEPKRPLIEVLHNLWDMYVKLDDQPSREKVTLLLKEIFKSKALIFYPEFDLLYVEQALALGRISCFREAEQVLEKAFHNCPVKSHLCKAMGDLKLWQKETVSFGWYMQACLLGYENYFPYLQLSEVAMTLGMAELGGRLLNASDILYSRGMRFAATDVEQTKLIVQKSPESICLALKKFLVFSDRFLPPADILPSSNDKQRWTWISFLKINPEGWPTPKTKILDRGFAR